MFWARRIAEVVIEGDEFSDDVGLIKDGEEKATRSELTRGVSKSGASGSASPSP